MLTGCGVDGGSLVYANTLYEPLSAFYVDAQWRDITDWRDVLAPFLRPSQVDAPPDAPLLPIASTITLDQGTVGGSP